MFVTFSIDLPRDATASQLARQQVADRLVATLEPPVLADVMLAVSELVTNALLHGTGQIELHIEVDDRSIRGEVVDAGRGLEQRIRDQGVEAPGLQIVGRVAQKWGVFQGTTHVWFEILLAGENPLVGEPPPGRLPES
jgi:anti-sigma regulatory factor (Ser/Thr protein kinase)